MRIEVERSTHFGRAFVIKCSEDELTELRTGLITAKTEGTYKDHFLNKEMTDVISDSLDGTGI